ncbi:MAG: hypothetical protein ACJ74Q_15240 [Pyrinomonadaceae bacterium]
MPETGDAPSRGPFRYYSFWFFRRPTCWWPEVALRLPAGEAAEDYVGHLGTPREITREQYYDFPSAARNTHQPRRVEARRTTEHCHA